MNWNVVVGGALFVVFNLFLVFSIGYIFAFFLRMLFKPDAAKVTVHGPGVISENELRLIFVPCAMALFCFAIVFGRCVWQGYC